MSRKPNPPAVLGLQSLSHTIKAFLLVTPQDHKNDLHKDSLICTTFLERINTSDQQTCMENRAILINFTHLIYERYLDVQD